MAGSLYRQEYWSVEYKELFNPVNRFAPFNRLRSVQAPISFLPRVAGEERDGGLNGLNYLNV
jgi:hypothetical protein